MPHKAVVAAGHAATADVAAAILKEGGNAVDAALAAMCAACIAEPVLASLGGGGFLMTQLGEGRRQGQTIVYDFFTQTPKRLRPASEIDFYPVHADFGPARQEFHIGMGSIATPGVVKGLIEVHRDAGRMPLRTVVEPAAALAREGVTVNAIQAYMIGVVAAILNANAAASALFASPERPGLVGEGDRFRLPELADVLEVLAIEGDDLFYRGEIGQRLCADCAGKGGHVRAEDLASYRLHRRRPLSLDAFGARVHLNPPPSTGGTLIGFGLALYESVRGDEAVPSAKSHLERLVAVMAATARARIEERLRLEPDGAGGSPLSPPLIAGYRDEILGRPAVRRGTTHISVIDRAGTAVSLSLSNGEGSGYVIPGTGVMMNNMLGEEDINPDGFHLWPSDVRMGSMMAPTLASTADGVLIALGSGGSNRIRTAILQVLLNLLVLGKPVTAAVADPRVHLEGETLSVEPGLAEAILAGLARDGPRLERWQEKNMFFGGVHAAVRNRAGAVSGAGDERRGGTVVIV